MLLSQARQEPGPSGPSPAIAILVNGASSSGKTTFCRALQERLTQRADGNPAEAFARVAFDDVVLLMAERPGSTSMTARPRGTTEGAQRLRLVLNPHGRRLLSGVHRSWGAHLELGTHLIIDHFLQDADWSEEVWEVLRLERRESTRGDGELAGRPIGLARRSDELCHSHGIPYQVRVSTDRQSTAQSVEAVVTALQQDGLLTG